jgi:two-component system cell cycle response regulator
MFIYNVLIKARNYFDEVTRMSNKITLSGLEKNLAFFRKMYDAVRIVDPVNKRVLECRGYSINQTNEICYDYWKSGKICDNCISVRAYHGKKSYIKLEQNPDTIMMVTALPVETAEPPV